MGKARKLGLIVNPIAGMGGRVGLKGTDGEDILNRAIELGAEPVSPRRAVEALERLSRIRDSLEVLTCSGPMGETELRECGFNPIIVSSVVGDKTTSADTISAAKAMAQAKVELLLFAGGDGTARDILDGIDGDVTVLGVPSGVKIHSAVFATSPRSAGDVALEFLRGGLVEVRQAEVMDIDEEAFRNDRVVARLYGYLNVPFEKTMIQSAKSGSSGDEQLALESIATDIVDGMDAGVLYVLGPGTTTRPIMDLLGLKKTLLGVDVVQDKKLVAADANEEKLLGLLRSSPGKIVVSVIGGQGFVFGRGSQQISPTVIRQVGPRNVIIVATPSKLASLQGAPLLVDTGDEKLDRTFEGYVRVVTGYGRKAMYRLKCA